MFKDPASLTRQWNDLKAKKFAAALSRGLTPPQADKAAEQETCEAFKLRKDINPDYEYEELINDYVLTEAAKKRQRELDMMDPT